ncbi:MAG TPA: alpha-amylase family glycosyl hydrolase [Gemmatimonadaceae bacterium]|nr:alpha-amylase family glycosyl hydrolase [Gemmatimonadaceae bacterium]
MRSRINGWLTAAFIAIASGATAQGRDVSQLAARPSAQWVKDAVIYELNPRTFSTAGTFNAITDRLDDLRALGVTVVWLMPIHPLGQLKKKGTIGSPYAVRDYYAINPSYGTKDDLRRLVGEAHKRGLKVIIDIVANHTAWDNVMMSTPAYYRRDAQGKIVSPYDWTDVAALDYANPATRTYMTNMLVYWLREFDLDGFRCDVAGEVPTDFWENARAELEKIKPDIMMLAEAAKPELLARAFDLDYAWPFYGTMADVVTSGRNAQDIARTWQEERRAYPRGAMHMRFTENHDEDRAIARFGERAAMATDALVFTLDGAPLLYNGQEAGDVTESGAPALFENLKVFWTGAERRPEMVELIKRLVSLRREHPALRQGQTVWLRNSDEDRIVTFLRRDGTEEFLVAVNLSNRPFAGTVEASGTYAEIPTPPNEARVVALPALSLDAWGFRIFRR